MFLQACIIAFTSDFIPREVYKYRNDQSMEGYVEDSLSIFNTTFFQKDAKPSNNTYPEEAGSLAGEEVDTCRYVCHSISFCHEFDFNNP